MTPSRLTKLAEQPWMTSHATSAVINALQKRGGTPRFVGGCVRDALLKCAVRDVDIAVDLTPEEVIDALTSAQIKSVATGLIHGTITAIPEDSDAIEVTSLREDIETDGRHAVVRYTKDWERDSLRRDFTMNALYADQSGEVFDFHGGLQDLYDGRIRFVGEAKDRIAEDRLRILRFFRFHAQLGLTEIEAQARDACLAARDGLRALSAERVAKELLRLLESSTPSDIIEDMCHGGILDYWLPEADRTDLLKHVVSQETTLDSADPIRRLSALCHPRASVAGQRLRLSRLDQARMQGMDRPLDRIENEKAARALTYTIGSKGASDSAIIGQALGIFGATTLFACAQGWPVPDFPVQGRDLITLGFDPGPELGLTLKRLEENWIESDFQLGRADLLALAKEKMR